MLAIGSFFSGIVSSLAKWAATIMGFMAGKYHEKNKANRKALDIKSEQLEIAGKRKYRRDELLAKARKRKR
jgi:hypothetical protein